jgi:hypothetical protein
LRILAIVGDVGPFQIASNFTTDIDWLCATEAEHNHLVGAWGKFTTAWLNLEFRTIPEKLAVVPPICEDIFRIVIHEHEHA